MNRAVRAIYEYMLMQRGEVIGITKAGDEYRIKIRYLARDYFPLKKSDYKRLTDVEAEATVFLRPNEPSS